MVGFCRVSGRDVEVVDVDFTARQLATAKADANRTVTFALQSLRIGTAIVVFRQVNPFVIYDLTMAAPGSNLQVLP